MADQTEKINRIITVVTLIWLCLLCVLIVFSLPIFPITICTTATFCSWILILSLFIAILNFIRVKTEHLALEILCLVLAFPFLGGLVNPFSVIHTPFTSQQFASYFERNFLSKGTVTYYRRLGFLLYSPQESEYGDISREPGFVSVSRNKTHVDATFMGAGADYQIENTHINLRGENISQFILSKKNPTFWEYIELTEDTVIYRSNYEVKKRLLSQDEYKKMRGELENMPLVDDISYGGEEVKNQYRYELSVMVRNDDSTYYADVDGQKLFESFKEFIISIP